MSKEERKIQEAIEKGIDVPGSQEDQRAYQLLFKELNKEEEMMPVLSPSFAEKIVKKLDEREVARMSLTEYAWKTAFVFLFGLASFIALMVVEGDAKILHRLVSLKWYFAMALFFLLIIDLLEKKLVKKVI